ncbi:HPr family phosphocarrier protein [Hazenella sp. IB182353]|uniref:HPr family phosphocarrier protein n=1 Tax=Polycladospora coralii TaxID=2771432 RepID=UPI0017479008|nr:HPr family phosphocarrier protein [Polycladospora coralii]MBS7530738.1 HPr family phosphocarrier protein [Polycladospora coralii]
MVEKRVVVRLQTGLHARPAALFVQEANKFSSDIFIMKGSHRVNAKSIMGVMSLAVSKGTEVTLSVDGTDEEKAMDALCDIISKEE